MNIKVDKRYTTLAMENEVKNAIKEFKARYTENDILNLVVNPYLEQIGKRSISGDILALNIDAYNNFDKVVFHITNMVVYGYTEVYTVNYIAMDINLEFAVSDSDVINEDVLRIYRRV